MYNSCWITGASSGIGKHTALYFAKKGFTVFASARSSKDLEKLVNESVTLSQKGSIIPVPLDVTIPDEISKRKIKVVHQEKKKEKLTWECNPYWTKVHLDINNPRLKNYLTLAGKGKRIELGAFLSPDERLELRDKIQNALAKANSA